MSAATGADAPVWVYGLSNPKPITTEAYYQAISDACVRAGVQRWTPYQCRHWAKRRVERLHGVDAARAYLRQRSIEATVHYAAQQDVETASKIAASIG